MRTFVHLVNPVAVAATSDLYQAQPVTFAAMRDARDWAAARGVKADLCAVGYPEDSAAAPAGFRHLPALSRSVLDTGEFRTPRKLPLLADLIARAVDAAAEANAEFVIYTNVDITPMPDFYLTICTLLDLGYDAFAINRRTLKKDWPGGVDDLPLMRAQIGEAHPGRDCFVFGRQAAGKYDLGLACIGAQYVGKVLAANMLCHASNYADFEDLHLTFHLGADRSWLAPTLGDYGEHNRRELAGVVDRLCTAGQNSAHPAWAELVSRFRTA